MIAGRRLSEREIGVALVLALLSALFVWWGIAQGAYFAPVFYPGAIGLFLLAGMLVAFAPLASGLRRGTLVVLGLLFALACWTALSLLWTPAKAHAAGDVEHVALYTAVFAVAIWVRRLLGQDSRLLLAPVAIAGVVVGAVTVATIGFGHDVVNYLHEDGTLRYPIGYRNADAAFFLICLWPLLDLAVSNRVPLLLRAGAVGAATMLLELGLLAQSRGSLPATAVAFVVFIAIARHRLRATAVLVLAALPMLPAVPTLLDVFQNGKGNASAIPLLHSSAQVILLTSLLSVVLAVLVLGLLYPRINLGPRRVSIIGRALAVAGVLVALIGGGALVARHGGPVGFVDQRVHELTKVGYPNLSRQSSRFGVDIGSNRGDFWRVALHEGGAHPVLGGGAGSFELTYEQKRRSGEDPKDPHSAEMLMLSELGVPGLLLFLAFVAGAGVLCVRYRRFTPFVAAAAAGGAQWFVHASYDWLWNYPGVTAPAIFLLGLAAGAPGERPGSGQLHRGLRVAAVCVLVVVAAGAVPLYLSDALTRQAIDKAPTNPAGAISDLESAHSWSPWDIVPVLDRGVIAEESGNQRLAAESFRQAQEIEPEGYLPWLFGARQAHAENPQAAAAQLAESRRLNPLDPEALRLKHRWAKEAEAAKQEAGGAKQTG